MFYPEIFSFWWIFSLISSRIYTYTVPIFYIATLDIRPIFQYPAFRLVGCTAVRIFGTLIVSQYPVIPHYSIATRIIRVLSPDSYLNYILYKVKVLYSKSLTATRYWRLSRVTSASTVCILYKNAVYVLFAAYKINKHSVICFVDT